MDPLILTFLESYVEYIGWKELPNPPKGWAAISRRLCEEYQYSPKHGREFLMIAFGWLWRSCDSQKMPYVQANVLTAYLKFELDKVYKIVAKENGWDEE